MPAHLFSSALFLPTPFFPSLSVSGTKFAYFSLLFTGSSQVPSPHIFLPVHQQLWVKAIASLCFFQRPTEHLVYNHQHQRYTSLAKHTLHAAPTSWELETHWDIVSDFWKQSLDCYLQNITLKAKFPYLEGRALPIGLITHQAGHRPLVRKLDHKFSSLHVLPYSKGTKDRQNPVFWGASCTLQSYISAHLSHMSSSGPPHSEDRNCIILPNCSQPDKITRKLHVKLNIFIHLSYL